MYCDALPDDIKHVDNNEQIETIFQESCATGNLEYLKMMNDHQNISQFMIKLNKYGHIPLYTALYHHHFGVAEFLIDNGASVNECMNKDGTSCFHYACGGQSQGFDDIVALMISRGIDDINSFDSSGMSPLHHSSKCGNINIVSELLKNRADVNIKDEFNRDSPLHYSCDKSHDIRIALILINNGAKINAINNYGFSCLHYACMKGHIDLAIFLIDNGCDYSLKDKVRGASMGYYIKDKAKALRLRSYISRHELWNRRKNFLMCLHGCVSLREERVVTACTVRIVIVGEVCFEEELRCNAYKVLNNEYYVREMLSFI